MKICKQCVLIMSLLVAMPSMAQDAMMDYVKKLSLRYPDASQRYETRLTPISNGRIRKETRYDLQISRSQLTAAEQQQLIKLYQSEWKQRETKNEKGVLYTDGDSVSCTIVYGLSQKAQTGINSHSLFTNNGFLMFDYGSIINIKVSKIERYVSKSAQPDFSAVKQCIAQLTDNNGSASATSVMYTGWKGFFNFQRGSGSGWTKGTRYTVRNTSTADFENIRTAFHACANGKTSAELIAYNDRLILHNEDGKEIFMASRDKKGAIYVLVATEGDEPCVPGDWEHIDFFNNGVTEHVDVSRLDSLYEALSNRPDALHTKVQYTGGGGKGCPGFQWQRGSGKGWTKGIRVAFPCTDETFINGIRSIFEYYYGKLPHVNLRHKEAATTYEEGTRTFYGYRLERDTLFFLRATTEDQICVPYNWPISSYYNNPFTDKDDIFGDASPATLRLFGLSQLWAEVKRNFVYYDKVSVNWDSLYVAMIPQIQKVADNNEANILLQKMVAQVHDGHTFIMGYDYGTTLPICTRLIGGKVYVDGVYNDKLTEKGVKRGMEISKIDGVDAVAYAKQKVFPLISSSTPQWTEHEAFDSDMLTAKRDAAQITLELKAADGSAQELTFQNYGSYKWQSYPQKPDLAFKVLDGNIGYLQISSFNNSDIREQFDNIFTEILKTKALIIDLRDNGGGNSGNGDYILSHLSNDSIRKGEWDTPQYRPAFASWGMKVDNYKGEGEYLHPAKGKPHYTKPIVTLINRGTFSCAEDFTSSLVWMKRGPIIGQPTGGSTGNGVQVELIPHSSSANICSKHDVGADGTEFVGIGIQPTIPVEETWESYFNSPIDNALQAALDWLKK